MLLRRILLTSVLTAGLTSTALAQTMGIATNPQGSLYYAVGSALSQVVSNKTKHQLRVQPMGGSSTYVPTINQGQIEFGLLNVIDPAFAWEGIENFKGQPPAKNLRLVAVIFQLPIGIAVVDNSPYKSLADLKGVRMPAEFTAQSTIRFVQDAVLANAGLATKDMQGVPVRDYVQGMRLLGEKRVDAALMGVGAAQAQEVNAKLQSDGGIRFLDLAESPEAAKRMQEIMPAYTYRQQPSSAIPGVKEGGATLMTYSAFIVSSSHVKDDVVYDIAKTAHDNAKELAAAHGSLRRFNPERMSEMHKVEWHPGAIKFYKEIGQWPPKGSK
jgi:TRAP transporter TAXI family solute receptor